LQGVTAGAEVGSGGSVGREGGKVAAAMVANGVGDGSGGKVSVGLAAAVWVTPASTVCTRAVWVAMIIFSEFGRLHEATITEMNNNPVSARVCFSISVSSLSNP